jgi:hypothetical protein
MSPVFLITYMDKPINLYALNGADHLHSVGYVTSAGKNGLGFLHIAYSEAIPGLDEHDRQHPYRPPGA